MSVSPTELAEFEVQADRWFAENKPEKPGFILPETFMEVGTDEQFKFLRAWQNKVYENGYVGLSWPKEFGGGGLPQVYQDIATKAMATHRVPFLLNTIGLNWAGPLILSMSSSEDKTKYIPSILSAEEIWCQGFSEPDHGSDLGNAQCKGRKDGDDYVINGSKIWTSLGMYAKHMILLVRTSTETKSKYSGLSFFLAPMQIDGIEVQPIRKLTGEYGFCQTFFNDARVPASCMMGKEGDGWRVAMATLMFERSAEGGQAGGLSMMDLSIDDVTELAKRAMRNGKPAIEDPFIRTELVKLIVEAKGNVYMADKAEIPALEGEWPGAVTMSIKLRATEFKRRMCQFAISLQGANASRYIDDRAVDEGMWQRSYLNAFSGTIGGGTTQIQHNIIGERILGLPKD